MKTHKLRSQVDKDGHVRVDIPTDLPAGSVDLVVTIEPAKAGYDFSDLAGRLRWSGDAVAEQRKLRDEWPD